MVFFRSSLVAYALALVVSSAANAHVTLNPKFVEPNQQNLTTSFHVPHGCNGSATVGLTINVPSNITVLTPQQQVSNWTFATTYTDDSNTTLSTISWTGGYLLATASLDFPITLNVPNVDLSNVVNITYYFPAVQNCVVGVNNWNLTNGAAGPGEPAPQLVVVKNATAAAAAAISISSNSSTSASASAPTASATGHANAANGLYAGLFPVVAVIVAVASSF